MAGISEFTHAFFEESSKAWKANKVRYGQAMYKYKIQPKELEEPPYKQSKAKQKQTEQELRKRQAIDEYAPPRVRRSQRLRDKEIQELYTQ
jgi:hypothetical protein